jgi:hypothetical protein
MFPNIQIFAFLAGGAFLLMIIAGTVGTFLEGSSPPGAGEEPPVEGKVFLAVFSALFLILCVAAVPLILRLFTYLQTAVGNGDTALVVFFRKRERTISYVMWSLTAGVFLAALPTMPREWWTR